jgi:hypothetical protein
MDTTETKLANWLRQNSILFYVYPVVPMFVFFLMTMVNSCLITSERSSCEDCSDSSDVLHEFLLAAMGGSFLLVITYANLVLELLWKRDKALVYNFYMFGGVLGLLTIWCLIGIYFVAASDCSSETYFYLAIVNIVLVLLFSSLMIVASIVYMCTSGRSKEDGTGDAAVAPVNEDTGREAKPMEATGDQD